MSRQRTPQTPAEIKTRQALLEAAASVFAEVGFRAATVRDICARAQANIAAVNYHFGDKETLYLEVLRYTQEQAYKQFPPDLGLSPDSTAEERLKAFIRSFLLRIFSKDSYHGKIISREMVDPSHALDTLVQERVRPQAKQLATILAELLGRTAEDKQVRLCAFSVVSQCVFYHHCRPVISRLFPQQQFDVADIEAIAEHVYNFSLTAVMQLRKQRKGRKS